MRKCLCLFICLLAAGCTAANGDPGYPVNGHADDAIYKVKIKPQKLWGDQCWIPTQEWVRMQVKNPKTARFDTTPAFDAYFDRGREVTVLVVTGVVISKGNYGQIYTQNYYVTWEQPGNLEHKAPDSTAWSRGDVNVFEPQL